MKPHSNLSCWLKDRFQSHRFSQIIRDKSIPIDGFEARHHLGGAIVFFFLTQFVTGIFLCMYYIPTVNDAFGSVRTLTSSVDFGWLFRSVHKWSSHLMVASVLLHLFATFVFRAYRAPRELLWITGWLLLAAVLAICFFGYLLPWNDLSFFATRTGIEIIGSVPLIGDGIVNLVQGSSEFTDSTLTRFYFFHVFFFPGILSVLLAMHLYFIQIHGVSELVRDTGSAAGEGRKLPFYPDFLFKTLVIWLALANVLVVLSFVFPIELGDHADRFAPMPTSIKPEWYFLPIYQFFKIMPSHILLFNGESLVLGVVFFVIVFFILLPFMDKAAKPSVRGKFIRLLAFLLSLLCLTMGGWGFFSSSGVVN